MKNSTDSDIYMCVRRIKILFADWSIKIFIVTCNV